MIRKIIHLLESYQTMEIKNMDNVVIFEFPTNVKTSTSGTYVTTQLKLPLRWFRSMIETNTMRK
jgi:hypothetical protein